MPPDTSSTQQDEPTREDALRRRILKGRWSIQEERDDDLVVLKLEPEPNGTPDERPDEPKFSDPPVDPETRARTKGAAGTIDSGGELRRTVDELRSEWS